MPRFITLFLPAILIAFFAIEKDGRAESRESRGAKTSGPLATSGSIKQVNRTEVIRSKQLRVELSQLDPLLLSTLSEKDRTQLSTYLEVSRKQEGGQISWCWSPETDTAKVAAFKAAEDLLRGEKGELLLFANQFLDNGRWRETAKDGRTSGRQGDPIIITWSLVPDGTPVPGTDAIPDRGSDLRAWLAGIYGGSAGGPLAEQPWFELFEEAFSSMAQTSGVDFQYEPNDDGVTLGGGSQGVVGVRGDIRIGTRFLDGNGGLLGISLGPDEGDMVLDSGDGLLALTGGDSLRLVNTLTHEIGHCLGLAHVCPVNQTKLMEPSLSTAFRGPQFDDHQSLQRLYGDPLEMDQDSRDNDTVLAATSIDLLPGSVLSLPRLSIDDDSDEDFFQLELLNGQRFQIEIIPGEGRYLEGGESPQGCSSGTFFDSGLVHDLRIEVFDRDGETILEAVDQFGPGNSEQTSWIEVPRNGSYFVKVSGGLTDAAQLYEMRIRLEEQLPGPRLVLGEFEVLAESGVEKNGRPDPGETVLVRIPVMNEGVGATGQILGEIESSPNVTFFSQATPTTIGPGETGWVEMVFGTGGVCGDEALIDLAVTAPSGELASGRFRFSLGEILSPVPLEEDFDGGAALPDDWSVSRISAGVGWSTTSSRRDTPLRSAFTRGVGSRGESILVSPSFELGAAGGVLQFRHLYRTEVGFDGGVLEVSRDGGEWADLVTGFNLAVTGGYNRTVREGFGSAIAGRMAWTGRLNSFQTTSVTLPAAWAGETVRFRWRFVEDQSGLSEGWWVDTVSFEMDVDECVDHRPGLSLRRVSGELDENSPTPGAVLELKSELPLLEEISVPLLVSGSAGLGDFFGDLSVALPAGETTISIPLQVVADDLNEGTETLVIEVPPDSHEFAPQGPSRVVIEVKDRTTLEGWAMSFPVPVDLVGDQDGDGLSGLGEYLLGTDPTSARSRVSLDPVIRAEGVLLPTGLLPGRDDAVLGVEVSIDLTEWQQISFQPTPEGLLVPHQGDEAFLRLTFARER